MLEGLKSNWRLWLAALVVLTLLIMAFCWWLWAPAPRVQETYKPAEKQADGSVVLEKKPDAHAVPKQIIPAGSKVQRLVSVTVQPRAMQQPASIPPATPVQEKPFTVYTTAHAVQPGPATAAALPCPPVTVDLSLVTSDDNTWRVIASSPDGAVVGGVDIPVEKAAPPPAPKLWAAGLVADPFRRTVGAFVDRDVAFARVGLQVNQREQGDLPNQVWVKAGIRF